MQVLEEMNMEEVFANIKLSKAVKGLSEHNPVMTQRFGADPYALVYDGRVYLYMTGDKPMYDADGKLLENTYSNINTICVVSSEDLVNWTDHGTVYAASETGAANWGANSWAPAAAYKNIDGKDKFFLYFANNGNGIAVLSADSPVGPFTDPINGPLISRQTPNCAEVTWLFDPAVLMDDDGSAYLYVGGGVPSLEMAANPGTARVVKLGDDMISLACDPQPIENVPFLFEDSGINKMGGKYFYSYCSNFSMMPEDEEKEGYLQGEIVTLVSDSPMGPFKRYKPVLRNPEHFFGLGGNNHHCMFEFKGNWYITYHARILEEAMGMNGGYRSTNIDVLEIENGGPSVSKGTRNGVAQLSHLNPYDEVKAVTMANSAGIDTVQYGEEAERCGSGDMIVTGMSDGSWIGVSGADFGNEEPFEICLKVGGNGSGAIRVSLDRPDGEVLAYVPVEEQDNEVADVFVSLDKTPSGVHDVFFTFAGEGYELHSWRFVK
ncbi:glycoside hydrolase family 43 protein [Butyrivibrio sp. INlla16]|uniref:glycoside hydrolase family 43 protein n=1 Tax=Butyrivibrio sp. INlla16 TaxID=1520807 RepID=UPI000889104D|nr:glycoside hydrolase family 43 protein [Butyrivibrio sp. INlla16]SDB27154.1 arabinoxylan arabinofuranohydrolase [Butyrivibrio sp. INlla16]